MPGPVTTLCVDFPPGVPQKLPEGSSRDPARVRPRIYSSLETSETSWWRKIVQGWCGEPGGSWLERGVG